MRKDYRLITDLTWRTFRDHWILEYEIPKYEGDLGQPSVFMPLPPEGSQQKVRYLMEAFLALYSKRRFKRRPFSPFCGCAGWNARRPADTPRRSTAVSRCCEGPET
jgi:hypothetical protein